MATKKKSVKARPRAKKLAPPLRVLPPVSLPPADPKRSPLATVWAWLRGKP